MTPPFWMWWKFNTIFHVPHVSITFFSRFISFSTTFWFSFSFKSFVKSHFRIYFLFVFSLFIFVYFCKLSVNNWHRAVMKKIAFDLIVLCPSCCVSAANRFAAIPIPFRTTGEWIENSKKWINEKKHDDISLTHISIFATFFVLLSLSLAHSFFFESKEFSHHLFYL